MSVSVRFWHWSMLWTCVTNSISHYATDRTIYSLLISVTHVIRYDYWQLLRQLQFKIYNRPARPSLTSGALYVCDRHAERHWKGLRAFPNNLRKIIYQFYIKLQQMAGPHIFYKQLFFYKFIDLLDVIKRHIFLYKTKFRRLDCVSVPR
jgi:hypothetical protein